MAEIELTQGQVALVDDADLEWLSRYKWTATLGPRGKRWLAVRGTHVRPGVYRLVYMAREIVGLEYGDSREADHKNFDTLDNRRGNLRIVSMAENRQHQPSRGGSSQYVGVTWDADRRKWKSQIQLDGKVRNLGRYETEVEAAAARDAFVLLQGTNHTLNLASRYSEAVTPC